MSVRTPLGLWAAVTVLLLVGVLPINAAEIHQAVIAGDLERVTALVRSEPDLGSLPDEGHQYHYRPLHYAAVNGHLDIARFLLDNGADVESGDSDESTPLHVAALERQAEMVALLMERGADVNRRDNNGGYGLSFAASGGDSAVVHMVLAAGADLDYENEYGVTLMHYAASRGLRELFDLLLDRGVDVNAATAAGDTPLHWLGFSGRTNMIAALLELGADPAPLNEQGETPLGRLAFGNHVDAARLLLDAGAEPGGADRFGRTPLHNAAVGGHADFVRLLVEHEVDLDHQDWRGQTALHRAAANGNSEVVTALLDAGAKTTVREGSFGHTALHLAALRGFRDVAEQLLAHGAPLECTDDAGGLPAQYAARYAHRGVNELFAQKGAKVPKTDRQRPCGISDQRVASTEEAIIWHLGHAGWAIKTAKHLLVFDYYEEDRLPDDPALCNGCIVPAEIADENVAVFVSHVHGDHYDPVIFDWREELPGITYVLGFQPAEEVPAHEYTAPRQERTIDGMRVTTIESNDSGVGFLVEVDGLTIFHAGDHANRERDFSGPYQTEIDWLAARGAQPDIAFMPISGCGFGDQVAVKMGVHYALETLQPHAFFPMHSGRATYRYSEFVEDCRDQFPQTRMVAVEGYGDHYRYRKGEILLRADAR